MDPLSLCNHCNKVFTYNNYLFHIETCNKQSLDTVTSNLNTINIITNANNNNNITNATNANNNGYDGCDGYDGYTESNNDESLNNEMFTNTQMFTNNIYIDMARNSGITDSNMLYLIDKFTNIGFGLKNINDFAVKYKIVSQQECTICLETHNIGHEFYFMNCGHIFCYTCSEQWFKLNSKCPICNYNFGKI
jgi:hypothetical protein